MLLLMEKSCTAYDAPNVVVIPVPTSGPRFFPSTVWAIVVLDKLKGYILLANCNFLLLYGTDFKSFSLFGMYQKALYLEQLMFVPFNAVLEL